MASCCTTFGESLSTTFASPCTFCSTSMASDEGTRHLTNQEENIRGQITGAYKQTFLDRLTEQLQGETQTADGVDWVVRLYVELRDRLCALLNKEGTIHSDLHGSFDVDLFRQMVEHEAFHADESVALINHVFGWIHRLQSPARDEETEAARQRVLEGRSTRTAADIVPEFVMEANECIDAIYKDLQSLSQSNATPQNNK